MKGVTTRRKVSLVGVIPSVTIRSRVSLNRCVGIVINFLSPSIFFSRLTFVRRGIVDQTSQYLRCLVRINRHLSRRPSQANDQIRRSFAMLQIKNFRSMISRLAKHRMLIRFSSRHHFRRGFMRNSFSIISHTRRKR